MGNMDWMTEGAQEGSSPQPRSFQFKPLEMENSPQGQAGETPMAPASTGEPAAPADTAAPPVQAVSSPMRVSSPEVQTPKTREEINNMGAGEFLTGLAKNAPASAMNIYEGLSNAVSNPAQTWEGMKQLGSGIYSKASGALGGESNPEKENVLNAMLGEYADAYGSVAGFKEKLYNDPFFVGMDAATLIPGVGAGMKAAGVGEKALKALNVAGKIIDPVQLGISAAKLPIKAAGSIGKAGAATASGIPKVAFDMAQEIGASGDKVGQKVFQKFATKKGNPQEIADAAVNSLDELKQQASNQYLSTRAGIAKSQTQLPMDKIENAMSDLESFVNSHGTTGRFRAAQDAMNDVRKQIDETAASGHPRARTMEDLDILKQSIQDIAQSFRGTRFEGKFGSVAGAVKDTIVAHDRVYAQMMDSYQGWLRQMKDLQTQLVGSPNASDTARIAKLLKSMGSDRKMDLLKMITATPSGQYLPHMIAGHALSTWAPSGSRGLIDVLAGGGLYYAGAHPLALAGGAALASPKIGGQIANKAGMAGRTFDRITPQAAMKPVSMLGNLEEDPREGRKSGGRVSSHEMAADQLVRAAERAKKGWSAQTEPLLNQSDESVVKALEVANRSI